MENTLRTQVSSTTSQLKSLNSKQGRRSVQFQLCLPQGLDKLNESSSVDIIRDINSQKREKVRPNIVLIQSNNTRWQYKKEEESARKGGKEHKDGANRIKKQKSISRQKQLDQFDFQGKFQKHRVNNLVHHFISKLRRTSAFKDPVQYEPFSLSPQQTDQLQGIQFCNNALTILLIFGFLFSLCNCMMSTFLLITPGNQATFIFKIFNTLWVLLEIFLGFIKTKEVSHHKVTKLNQIIRTYLKKEFAYDLFYFICCFCSIFSTDTTARVFHSLVLLRLVDVYNKSKLIENKLINFLYQEQYWGLFKMVLSNFLLAHFGAIVLILMANPQDPHNWLIVKNISNADWQEQYCWAYYWSTTIIFSVGFGDIVATNYREAMVLVVIEILGCMFLAYNINRIGALLTKLHERQNEKQKKVKMVKQMCDRSSIQSDLEFKLTSFVNESYKMEEKLKIQQCIQFVAKLPENLKQDYQRESNKKILQKIKFLSHFTNKTILKIAQKIQQKMLHPWQIAIKPETKELIILKQGQIAMCPNFNTRKYGQIAIDQFSTKEKQGPLLVSLDFVRPNQIIRNYDFKSIGCSIIGRICYSDFVEILKQKPVDAQFFFSYRQRERKDYQDFEVLNCLACKSQHSKFTCPRLHYSPVSQQIIYRELQRIKKSKTMRRKFQREKIKINSLNFFSQNQWNFNSEEIFNFYQQKFTTNFINAKTMSLNFIEPESTIKKTIKSIKETRPKTILKHNAKQVRYQMAKSLAEKNVFDLWIVQIDKVYDYQYFFPIENSRQLIKMPLNCCKNSIKKSNKVFKIKSALKKCF